MEQQAMFYGQAEWSRTLRARHQDGATVAWCSTQQVVTR
jgi:hypothetical protein